MKSTDSINDDLLFASFLRLLQDSKRFSMGFEGKRKKKDTLPSIS